jgi:predicted GNAT family acetyltransferase
LSEFEIREDAGPQRGRYVLTLDGQTAELTYTVASPGLRIADHAGAPVSMRGKGVGHALVRRMVEDARAQRFRIVPRCPFVEAERQKNPDWSDAFET